MTQRDIEPLREICMDLGISALMARSTGKDQDQDKDQEN